MLTTCDSEQIHLLGGIQPIGFLLSVSSDWIVVRASQNSGLYLGVEPEEIVGHAILNHLSSALLHDIRGRLQTAIGTGIVERLFGYELSPGGRRFDIAVHFSGRETILEFEPSAGELRAPLSVLRSMMARVERRTSIEAICGEAARQIRALTGFDRVMVYRFDEDGAGEVIAETLTGDLSPFLGLRYPASDIPSQARALYKRNFLRIISDVDADPIPIVPMMLPDGAALDLSMSSLRSVSPIHIEYLRNMGVKASMSISIICDGELWGLVACHHGQAAHLSLETRSTAELFGQMFSYLLEGRQRDEETRFDERTKEMHHRIAAAFASPGAFLDDIPSFLASISNYIAADGVGIYYDGKINLTGLTPTREEFLQLIIFLNKTASGRVFATHHLGNTFSSAQDYSMRAAGLLSIPISRSPRDYLVFFRKEVEKTITWASEPEKLGSLGPNGVRLTPRKSFEAWRETVRSQSERWSKREQRAAEALRVTLVDLMLRMSETAHADSAAAKQSQEILIAELNHRVRNILGLVRGLISQTAATAGDVRSLVDSLDSRIRSLARSQDLLTESDWKPTSLHKLLFSEIETYGRIEDRLVLIGPDAMLQPKAFTPIALVIHELTTNARKYGALSSDAGKITFTTSQDDLGNVNINWQESGGPPVSVPIRRGFGSTILEQVIPFELNGSSLPRYLPRGYCLDIVVPAAVAQLSTADRVSKTEGNKDEAAVDVSQLPELLSRCLVVEDNLFIAIDAEDLLRALGATSVTVSNSVTHALGVIEQQSFSFALLDVNLGAENSLPIARLLKSREIPFAFGTGYGDGLSMSDAFADVLVITKPYNQASMVSALKSLLNHAARAGHLSDSEADCS